MDKNKYWKNWNVDSYRNLFAIVRGYAKEDGFTDEELSELNLDKLSHQTSSKRFHRMLKLAFFLGWMRGVRYVDSSHNLISPSLLDAPKGFQPTLAPDHRGTDYYCIQGKKFPATPEGITLAKEVLVSSGLTESEATEHMVRLYFSHTGSTDPKALVRDGLYT